MHYNELVPAQADALVPHADRLRLAVAAYLARFKGTSRDHTDSDLRCYLAWCAERSLDPFLARRPHLELYIRWMQEARRFKLVPLPPAVGRAVDRAADHSNSGPVLSTATARGWTGMPPRGGSGGSPRQRESG
jgi:hypothetical protein